MIGQRLIHRRHRVRIHQYLDHLSRPAGGPAGVQDVLILVNRKKYDLGIVTLSLSSSATSIPLIPGFEMSKTTKSGLSLNAASRAAPPSETVLNDIECLA
jgi:hypothetical protein